MRTGFCSYVLGVSPQTQTFTVLFMTDSEHNAWLEAALANTLAGEPVENITISSNEIGIHDAYALQQCCSAVATHGHMLAQLRVRFDYNKDFSTSRKA